MSSTGSGYDYSCGTFSPDGRIFQVEYAQKAVENSGTAIGIKCVDGIVLAVEKPKVSKMLVMGSNRRVFGIDSHVGVAITGYAADGRQLVHRSRDEAQNYRDTYGHSIVPSILASRLGLYVHYFTVHGSLRPFGSSALLAAYDQDLKVPELYMIEPSGQVLRYFACSAGKGAQAAKTELEKVVSKQAALTCRDAVNELARILHVIRDPSKDRPFELEMCWLCQESNWSHSVVPPDLVVAAEDAAKVLVVGAAGEAALQSRVDEAASGIIAIPGEDEKQDVEEPVRESPMDI